MLASCDYVTFSCRLLSHCITHVRRILETAFDSLSSFWIPEKRFTKNDPVEKNPPKTLWANFIEIIWLDKLLMLLERSSLHEGRTGDLFHRKWNVIMNTVSVTIEPLPDHTRSSLTVCPCVRTHLGCRYAWGALSRSFLRCRYAWVSLPRSYWRWTNICKTKPADSVPTIKEKPGILSHTSTDIWHRFKFQQSMFTTYWF